MLVSNGDELGRELRDKKDEIEIAVDLKTYVVRIKATGRVAWAVAIGVIGVAIVGAIPTGGSSLAVGAPVAVSILGLGATGFLIAVGVAAGSVGAAMSLYNGYDLVDRAGHHYLIRKK